jgi:hypothetical protein
MPQGIVAVLVVSGLIGMLALITHFERQKLLRMAAAFVTGGQVEGWFPPRLVARHRGYRVEYRIMKHQQRHGHGFHHHSHARGHSTVTLRTAGGPTWTAAPEGFGTSLLKGLGVMSDIELGIEDLDRKLRFSAKAPRRLPDMLARKPAEEALRTLSNHPRFLGLRCDDAKVEARYNYESSEDYDDRELLHRLEPLLDLAQATGARPAL